MEKSHRTRETEGGKARSLLFALFLSLMVASISSASEIPLTWDPSTDAVSGYRVYYGTSPKALKQMVDVGDTTDTVLDLNLPKKKHYFGVTAYDNSGEESDLSNLISWPLYLVSPNGNDILESGSTATIEWDAASEAVSFSLLYSVGGAWTPIADHLTDKTYEWTVPSPTSNTTKALVKVIGYDYTGKKLGEDQSDHPFGIEVVRLTSPNGGEVLTSGQSRTITWETHATKNTVAQVQLSYSINGGSGWAPIATLDNNPGSYSWTVPVPKGSKTSTRCRVKVMLKNSKGAAVGSDISDANLTIQPN